MLWPKRVTANFINTYELVHYRGAGKSLARPGRKQATFCVFNGTSRFITTFTTAHDLSLP